MKRLSIILILVMLATVGYAQKQKKPSVNKAKIELEKGNLDVAKEIIDQATTYEKTKGKANTWYYRGKIYRSIIESDNAAYSGLVPKEEGIKIATESFKKVIELEPETGSLNIFSNQEVEAMWGGYINAGVQDYQNGDYASAQKAFELSSIVKPQDTTGFLYAATCAREVEDYEGAIRNYKGLNGIEPREDVYASIISIQKDIQKDYDAALATIEESKNDFPSSTMIGKFEIDILILADKIEDAMKRLVTAIEAEPENAILHLRQGLLFDQLVSAEKKKDTPNEELIESYTTNAEKAYERTLEIEPDNLTANFNYSVIYSQKANEVYNELNNMDMKQYQKNFDDYKKRGDEYVAKALPYMEKAYEKDNSDESVLAALEIYYDKLKMDDKKAEIQARMKELGIID